VKRYRKYFLCKWLSKWWFREWNLERHLKIPYRVVWIHIDHVSSLQPAYIDQMLVIVCLSSSSDFWISRGRSAPSLWTKCRNVQVGKLHTLHSSFFLNFRMISLAANYSHLVVPKQTIRLHCRYTLPPYRNICHNWLVFTTSIICLIKNM
jgi:hypothetical protein